MSLLRTEGHVYRMELSGRFGLKFPNQNGIACSVTRGSCFLNINGGELVPLVAGDFVLLRGETWDSRNDKNIAANKPLSAEQKAQYQLTKRLAFDEWRVVGKTPLDHLFLSAWKSARFVTL